jgi:hypothetical protein
MLRVGDRAPNASMPLTAMRRLEWRTGFCLSYWRSGSALKFRSHLFFERART